MLPETSPPRLQPHPGEDRCVTAILKFDRRAAGKTSLCPQLVRNHARLTTVCDDLLVKKTVNSERTGLS